jgi:hypothetical protein
MGNKLFHSHDAFSFGCLIIRALHIGSLRALISADLSLTHAIVVPPPFATF